LICLPASKYECSISADAWGAEVRANTVVDLSDGSIINFLYEVDGLRCFHQEYQRARKVNWLGSKVRVLPLDRIYASKKFVARPKDLALTYPCWHRP
jgi:hypothetical protein